MKISVLSLAAALLAPAGDYAAFVPASSSVPATAFRPRTVTAAPTAALLALEKSSADDDASGAEDGGPNPPDLYPS